MTNLCQAAQHARPAAWHRETSEEPRWLTRDAHAQRTAYACVQASAQHIYLTGRRSPAHNPQDITRVMLKENEKFVKSPMPGAVRE